MAKAERFEDLHALEGVDVRVEVFGFDSDFIEVFGEVLRELFREGGDKDAAAKFSFFADFVEAVVDLAIGRTDFNLRIEEASGAENLFDDVAF